MKHEVRAIPPAPRRIRLRPLFAHRWPLLAIGGLATVIGLLVAWAMFLQAGGLPSQQARLEAGPVSRVTGSISHVDRPLTWQGSRWQRVSYTFLWQGGTRHGSSFGPAGRFAVQDAIDVDVLPDEPFVSRLAGGRLLFDPPWTHARFWLGLLAVPGALLLLGWLAGVFQLRQVLLHGDVSIGQVERIQPIRLLLPEMLRVDYTFRDHRARIRHGRHWVRLHGELGARLLAQLGSGQLEAMPVLHDRRLPQWNRMVLPQDFLPPPAAASTATATGLGGSPHL
jgi:hypothetical protein